ncbi:Sensitivity To Red Light Reduced-like protein [Cinnamomum micranthum f. kanehirae]|uniref:Sensitivity To Red Light Reduced-like protein n=1 Tax=Cinnamomum micranthum f. kanehirae TaxID=337451 RepID=A0A443P7V3_9MAGN|nr:Sensitivity To Red Light Reduced-like protein [Cinnamomum micranthum f. kanehirae]
MQLTLSNLKSSSFYRTLVAQIQTPQLLSNFSITLSSSQSQNKMQMVIYGIGNINSYKPPHLQLSLAILLSRRFISMIEGWIKVFNPIISKVESSLMEALGCMVLTIDEQGRREAERPTLFFMMHCKVELYNNLLEANWRPEWLNRMVVFGNSFERYHSFVSEFKCSIVGKYSGYVLEARRLGLIWFVRISLGLFTTRAGISSI